MDTEKRELWDRLKNEPERAYRAFEYFLRLPSSERTLLAAYRQHVDNPNVTKPSDTYSGWSHRFAWRERAAAYDDHLTSLRRAAHEQAITEEAAQQAREIEKIRGRMHELMTVAYLRAMECLEDQDWVRDNLRSSDVIQVMKLYVDYLKAFGEDRQTKDEDDWSEEDLAAGEQIMKEIEERDYPEEEDML